MPEYLSYLELPVVIFSFLPTPLSFWQYCRDLKLRQYFPVLIVYFACVLDAGSNEESGDLALFFFWDSLIKILYFWCSTGCCYKKFENICMIVTYGRHKVKLTSKCRTQLEGFLYWIFEVYLQNLHVPCIHSSPSLRLSSLRTLSLAFGSIVNFAITSGVSLKKLKTPFSNHWGIFSCKPAILAMITIN